MVISENMLKWAMRIYPPLFFQRIWVRKFEKGFRGVDVKIIKSPFNSNYNRSIFGGTIFSASDPFYPVLFDQVLQRKGFKVRVWLKSAEIRYLKPARSNLYFSLRLSDKDIDEACDVLNTVGKHVKSYPVEMFNDEGVLCVSVMNEVYLRNLYSGENQTVAY